MDGTPSFVVGEHVIAGALGYDTLRQLVALVREQKK
jgi:protein-disulfide isomerase